MQSHQASKDWKTTILQTFRTWPHQKQMLALYERLLDIVSHEASAPSTQYINDMFHV